MEILLGFLVSLLTEVGKYLTKKFGKEMSSVIVRTFVLSCSLILTLLMSAEIISIEILKSFVYTLGIAIGFYELVTKNLAR